MKREHMVRGAFIIFAFIILFSFILVIAAATYQDSPLDVIPTTTTEETKFNNDIIYIPQNYSYECEEEIAKCKEYISYLNTLELTDLIQEEIKRVESIIYTQECDLELFLDKEREQAKWDQRKAEYPIATEVWLYMKINFGWSDKVCAGIMGNIMAEIGGGTLDFSDWNWNERTLGMFQWLGGRKTNIKKLYGEIPTIEEQLEFMYDELYGTDGVRQQVTDYQRERILSSETPEQAAKRFSDWFERPGNSGASRKGYARKAYNYFVD